MFQWHYFVFNSLHSQIKYDRNNNVGVYNNIRDNFKYVQLSFDVCLIINISLH